MKYCKFFRQFIFMLLIISIANGCNNHQATTLSKADTTVILQAVFDFQNADFDTVAAISKRKTSDIVAIFRNKIIGNDYILTYKNKTIHYTSTDPLTAQMTLSRPQMVLHFWHFKKQPNGDTVQISFGIRDWGLICDYRLAKEANKWRVVGLGNSEGKF